MLLDGGTMSDMLSLRLADPKHYDDRRSHLVELGATDRSIQEWAQYAVDHGIPVATYLSQIERWITTNDSCRADANRYDFLTNWFAS
jgi:hypothetical protein